MTVFTAKMLIPALFLLWLAAPSSQQTLQSPCPDVLQYEEITKDEPNRWYATIKFPPGANWLFLNIILDKKANILANWYGGVTTLDNTEYKIESPDPNVRSKREPMRFFVQFDPEEPPPKVQLIRVDGREICFENGIRQNYVEPPVSSTSAAPVSHTTRAVTYVRPTHFTTEPSFRVPINIFEQNNQCGLVKMNNPVALVVGGTPTLEGQWPWQIALYWTEFVNLNYKCGGTLVSHRHVITAAHCVTVAGSQPPQNVHESTLSVYLGKHDLTTSVKGVQIRTVSKITVYPDYDLESRYGKDLSVLELAEPVKYTNWVQPACLWPDELSDISFIIGQTGSVVGWGNNGSGKLLLVEMPIVSQEVCLRAKGEFYLSVTSEYTFCAGSRNGQSACNGDSGGGMVLKMNGIWYLRGVVSIAPSKPNENVCDPTFYVVFTDIAKYLPWIRENIEPY